MQELKTSSEYLLEHMKQGHEVLSLSYNAQSRGLGSLVGSLATASDFAQALSKASELSELSELSDLSTELSSISQLSKFAKLAESNAWPSSLPEPRVQARGPLGSLGDRGF